MKNINNSKSGFVVVKAPAGFHADLFTNVSDIQGSFPSSGSSYRFFVQVAANKGKWSPTSDGAIQDLKKAISKEIARLEKRGNHRPSAVRRLDLLRAVV